MARNPNMGSMMAPEYFRRFEHRTVKRTSRRMSRCMRDGLRRAKRHQRRTLRQSLSQGDWDIQVSSTPAPWDWF